MPLGMFSGLCIFWEMCAIGEELTEFNDVSLIL